MSVEESVELGEQLHEEVAVYLDFEELAGVVSVEEEVLVRSGAKRGLMSAGVSIDVTDEFAAEGEEGGGNLVVLRGAGLSIG